jgi:hypothetical protein
MVIDARTIFRCAHAYVVLKHRGAMVFTCMTCGYRTEELPIRTKTPAHQVVAFPAAVTAERIATKITKIG